MSTTAASDEISRTVMPRKAKIFENMMVKNKQTEGDGE